MFIGHFALGLGAKKLAPNVSLGTFFIAIQFLDLLWPTLLLLGIEHVEIRPEFRGNEVLHFTDYPISHSLLMTIVWSVFLGGLYWLVKKDLKSAFIIGICVASHWVLDLIVHFPDLPIYPGASPLFGMGLWAYPVLEIIIEIIMLIIGVVIYLRTTYPINKIGVFAFWIIILLLLVVQLSSDFSPAPTDVKTLAWSAQAIWIFVALGYWVDHNRKVKSSTVSEL